MGWRRAALFSLSGTLEAKWSEQLLRDVREVGALKFKGWADGFRDRPRDTGYLMERGGQKAYLAMGHRVTKGWADRTARGEVGTEASGMAEDPG